MNNKRDFHIILTGKNFNELETFVNKVNNELTDEKTTKTELTRMLITNMVKETPESVVEQIIEYRREL